MKLSFMPVVFCLTIGGGCDNASLPEDALTPAFLGDVKVKGHVAEIQDRFFRNRIFSKFAKDEVWKEARDAFANPDDDIFKKPVGMWKGEFWGKLMISACRVAQYSGDENLKEFLHAEGLRLISFQHDDGYLGTYVDKEFIAPKQEAKIINVPGVSPQWNWNLWCRKYTLWGLLSCYRLTGDRKLLQAADRAMSQQISMLKRLGVKLCDTGTTTMRGLPPCSILKPLIWLYCDTGKKEYLDYAKEIIGYWNEEGNNAPQFMKLVETGKPMYEWYPDEIGHWAKAYEMMSCLDGVLEYYRVTGERQSLELVRTIQRDIRTNEQNPCLSVGYNDQFTGAARHINGVTEPCDAVHWMRLNHDLLLITGEAEYAEAIESTFYNAFLAGVRPDGKWGARCVRSHVCHQAAPPQSGMKLQHCCVNNIPRGFMDVAQTIALEDSKGTICIAMYHDAAINLRAGTVGIAGEYPVRDEITVKINRKKPGKVRFRIPEWSRHMTVCNGMMCMPALGNGWLDAEAPAGASEWAIHFGMVPRMVGLECVPYRPSNPDYQKGRWGLDQGTLRRTPAAEIMYGPLLLAKSVRLGCTESQLMDSSTIKGEEWKIALEDENAPDGVWAAWKLTLEKDSQKRIFRVCDFSSAAEWMGKRTEFSVFF